MNISDLVRAIGTPDFTFEPVELECNGIKFKVKIKKEMSVADSEFIFKPKSEFDDSFSCRRIHRLVLFVTEGVDERPTLQQVMEFPIALVSTLGAAIDGVQVKKEPGKPAVKKNLRRRMSSGTK